MMNEIEFRAITMEGMNNYVLNTIGDDEITDYWFTYGIPDGLDKSGYLEIAENENEWLDIVKAFGKCLEMREEN